MNALRLALSALLLSALPALPGTTAVDLPRLDFGPASAPAPATRTCIDPVATTAVPCTTQK